MKKTRGKLLSILMAATISATMLLPQAKVSASEDAAAKVQQAYFPKKVTMKKAARKTEPAEWNKTDVKVYKFGNAEDALYYMMTGGIKYYNRNYFKNPEKIKITPVESGSLFLVIAGDNEQAGAIYDADQKLIKKVSLTYVKADVKAGETYYVDFPRNCKEGLLTAYVLENECKGLVKDDLNMQKGEGKETYHTFKLTKRGYASFLVASLVENVGKTSYKIQKSEKGKWVTIGRTKTFSAMSTKESDITAAYGLAKGTYRLVLNASKEQLNTVVYERKYYSKKVAYKKSKAKKLNAKEVYTTNERAARWYKTEVTSTKKQKKLKISTAADQGGFKFTIYQSGKKKPIKTVKTSVKHLDKTVKLPKKKGTYYVKVSKVTKKTNGYYEIKK
ncbi:hypothetical protein [Anaerostipes sp.]|uniref:hypothetical protein n=1 Tax=Anaerostipes sp. TaxID=1872530 RepID=UPI0039672B40